MLRRRRVAQAEGCQGTLTIKLAPTQSATFSQRTTTSADRLVVKPRH